MVAVDRSDGSPVLELNSEAEGTIRTAVLDTADEVSSEDDAGTLELEVDGMLDTAADADVESNEFVLELTARS